VLGLVAGCQLTADLLDPLDGLFQELGQEVRRDGLDRRQENGFDGPVFFGDPHDETV
jgi:hypothetical protein